MFGTHSIHLSGGETVATTQGSNHDAIYVAATANASSLGIVLGHSIPAADRVKFLHALADAAVGLAATIMQREEVPLSRGAALAERHMAEAMAKAGIGGRS